MRDRLASVFGLAVTVLPGSGTTCPNVMSVALEEYVAAGLLTFVDDDDGVRGRAGIFDRDLRERPTSAVPTEFVRPTPLVSADEDDEVGAVNEWLFLDA